MQRFFGVLISTLYRVDEKKHQPKHFMVYKEAEQHGPHILKQAFPLSLELTSTPAVTSNYEKRVLQYSLQVFNGTINGQTILLIQMMCSKFGTF